MSIEENPFASPPEIDDDAVVEVVGDAEDIRRQYFNHEAAIRSIGFLYYLGGVLFALPALMMVPMLGMLLMGCGGPHPVSVAGFIAICGGLAAVSFALGRSLRTLTRWVRIPVGIISALGLLGATIGTVGVAGIPMLLRFVYLIVAVINGYILYVLFCRKGRMVFSLEYREVVRRTPHVNYKSPLVAVLFLVVVIALLAACILPMVLSR